ncbi:MAG: hypothetical protein EAZ53_11065 [Bacteroidetes bacterium]|nr:MAG: hypothetical protein EAZ53_11065 [Bacteroidota bacterium]
MGFCKRKHYANIGIGLGSATIATSGNIQLSTSFTNSYSVTNLSATTLAQAKNGNGTIPAYYISVTISPNPNFAIDISSVAIQGFSQNRNRTFNLSYIDAQSNLINVQNRTITTPTQAQTFTINSLTGIQTPIELRFYIFSNPADVYEAAGFGEATGLDLVINGKITNTTTNPILPGMWSLQGNTVAGSQFLGSVNNEAIKVYTNNSEKVRITADGNVGIGTTAPTQKLSVAGNINLTGTGTGLIFDDGTFINSASKINQAVLNGQTTNVSLIGLALQNLTYTGNRINFTGSALEFYTPVQGQYNGNKPVLSMSQYGEINFYSSPYLNDNAMYFGNTGNFNNGIRKANDFGGVGGYSGPVVFGENGGALGSSTANSNWNTTGTKLALSWDANQTVKIYKALQFADGTVQTTAGSNWQMTNNYLTYPQNVNVQGKLKIGTNSLIIDATNSPSGPLNELYTDATTPTAPTNLKIQSNAINPNGNTILNELGGKVLIGTGASTIPAKLYVDGDIYATGRISSQYGLIELGNPSVIPGSGGVMGVPNAIFLGANGITMNTNFSPQLYLNNSGNLGIGLKLNLRC